MNLRNIWQAAYTAGTILPKPIATAQYWHRSLNPKKLIEVQFSRLGVSLIADDSSLCAVWKLNFNSSSLSLPRVQMAFLPLLGPVQKLLQIEFASLVLREI